MLLGLDYSEAVAADTCAMLPSRLPASRVGRSLRSVTASKATRNQIELWHT
jgi:hypothetical protein